MSPLAYPLSPVGRPLFENAAGDVEVSFEFFPPRTEKMEAALWEAIRTLEPLQPRFVSVTYGAGGSTRDGTVEITAALKDELGFETMAHLSCVGETREGLARILDRYAAAGIENVLAALVPWFGALTVALLFGATVDAGGATNSPD